MIRNFALMAMLAFVPALRAEKVPMSPAELRQTATHIVTGQVMAVYERTEEAGDWRVTRYVAEVRVGAVEKDDGIKKDDLVYVRYWRQAWIGKGQVPPSTAGHRGLPGKGDTQRVYLARNAYDGFTRDNHDGGYNVIGADGFEAMKK